MSAVFESKETSAYLPEFRILFGVGAHHEIDSTSLHGKASFAVPTSSYSVVCVAADRMSLNNRFSRFFFCVLEGDYGSFPGGKVCVDHFRSRALAGPIGGPFLLSLFCEARFRSRFTERFSSTHPHTNTHCRLVR